MVGLSVKKKDNFGEWYSQVLTHGEMIDYYDVSGCYPLRASSVSIWEQIQAFIDAELKKVGVKKECFPILISKMALTKEKDHVEGSAPDLAWVTKAGSKELEEPIAIRPTSQTAILPSFARRIRSHRDLPLRLNQCGSVFRWEVTDPTPFIRSREFQLQEGHSAFATEEEADKEAYEVLELYRRVYEELLAVPVVKGIKSDSGKFSGALCTASLEAYISTTGRGIQVATSNCLGQNISKVFEIFYENDNQERQLVWLNSWGVSTRAIGVIVMVHGDDKGLVFPPRVAPVQVVIIHIPRNDINTKVLMDACHETAQKLRDVGIRVEEDYSENHSPGWKSSDWELKGVPIRLEIGPKDITGKVVKVIRRDNGVKGFLPVETVGKDINDLLDDIQQNLLFKARLERDSGMAKATTWEEFMGALTKKKMVLAPWCDEAAVEEEVKEKTKGGLNGAAKTLCMPLEQPDLPEGSVCFTSGKPAKRWALWGRSY